MTIIGIDPGLDGAVAVLHGLEQTVVDLPTMAAGKGKGTSKRKLNGAALAEILRLFGPDCMVFIEAVSAMPRQQIHKIGVATAFSFGRTVGCIEGVCQALWLPIEFVTPGTWKKYFGLPADKEVARAKAIEFYPGMELHLKKHHGRAESLLIARYGLEVRARTA
jgi:crossover junction endodeoxyribonuclease RuvC